MLMYLNQCMYYSTEAVWATAAFILAALPVGVYILRLEVCLLGESWLAALDWVMAAILVNGMLTPFLQWNLTPGGRPDLYALRSASALLTSAALIGLCVHSLSRMQLLLCNGLYVGISLNLASWSSALWLHLQPLGLGGLLLPDQWLHALRTKPLLQWLREYAAAPVTLLQLRQVVPLLIVPDEHLETALEVLPAALRHRLAQPPLAELPQPVREVMQPWEEGPGHLRVRQLGLLPKATLNQKNHHPHHGRPDGAPPLPPAELPPLPRAASPSGSMPTATRASVPEWVYVYVLRRHLQTRLGGLRASLDAKRSAMLMLLALAALRVLRPAAARRLTSSRAASLATKCVVLPGLLLWALRQPSHALRENPPARANAAPAPAGRCPVSL